MTVRVLLVEDDELLVKRIESHFDDSGFSFVTDITGANAMDIVQSRQNDPSQAIQLAIVDIVLPEKDGLLLAKELNTLTDIGVIVLSSRDSQSDRIAGLAQGADDYICKPVDLLELELRMRALCKRIVVETQDDSDDYIEYADIKVHPEHRTLICGDSEEMRLTEAEHKVLICLISNAGKATSREKLSEEIGQTDWSPADRTVDVLIGRLRKKLSDEKDQKRIVTVRGKGYMISLA